MSTTNLPTKDSPDIQLVVATPEELLAQQHANSDEWRGALSLEAYLRREDYLLDQELTKDGGLTPWMLVHQPPHGGPRQALAGCESIRKKALLAKDGRVDDLVAHGVASVFSPPKHRGRGYAGRMMTEVGKRLRSWQVSEGEHAACSILYSDIGKQFYAARGWEPFPSAHVALPAKSSPSSDLPTVRRLESDDIPELCAIDEKLLRSRLAQRSQPGRTAVALVPDITTLHWHHAREDFVAKELHGGVPQSGRGAMVGDMAGSRVWCYWTRVWTSPNEEAPNTLHILRIVIEDDAYSDFEPASDEGAQKLKESPALKAVAALFVEAQAVAEMSGMDEVQIWNPTSTTLAAVRLLDPKAAVVHREKESITSLQWYGEGSWEDVDWVCNEKFGWC